MSSQHEPSPTQAIYNDECLAKQYDNLIRKIDITRRSRFQMANRLKKEHEWRKSLLLYYNIIIIVLSIITMYQYFIIGVPMAAHIILAFSISLSLYSTHIEGTSRLETAGIITQNAHALSSILNNAQITKTKVLSRDEHLATIERLSEKYESTNDNVQNHEDIDYAYVKRKGFSSTKTKEFVYTTTPIMRQEYTSKACADVIPSPTAESPTVNPKSSNIDEEIRRYEKRETTKKVLGYLLGALIAFGTLFYPRLSLLFKLLFP